ncbi:Protein sfk1 [Neolecta irregularis DAH-3]|uniref:Protein sfk1 n=1 Tax=Neolecta irregularis (strain DAH-3) TaxID=1198029 RepID=A0A1U7LV48_NEOID|nr:Protein sfk1 [Neolecta irregularis DAH-3]|eukprot:OLL26391.1 Protein sfk1 [Neolecta irregularis DAH-3]
MGRPNYQRAPHSVVFISDVGRKVEPLFIACSFIIGPGFALSFIADNYLRLKGHLAGAEDRRERIFAALTITCGIISAIAMIMMSFVDDHLRHWSLAFIFAITVWASGIFSALQFLYLYRHNPQCTSLLISFVLKIVLMIISLCLVSTGLIFSTIDMSRAATVEWCASLIFAFFLVTLIYDLLPARSCELIYVEILDKENETI